MVHVTAGLLLVLEYGFALFCFVDVLRAPEAAVAWMPRWGWVVAILVFPLAGAVAWIVATRPWRSAVRGTAEGGTGKAPASAVPATGPTAVGTARECHFGSLEEDAALLAQLWDVNEEHERTLRRWEDDLARREEALRQRLRRERAGRDRHMDAA
jgi:Phospholipase_D-nuclease N-terminal